jgi:hypothetical protein
LRAVYPRYRQARRREKPRILDEFRRIAGYHRKYAIRLLDGPAPQTPLGRIHAAPQQDRAKVAALLALRHRLDPFVLAQTIDQKIERLPAWPAAAPAAGAGFRPSSSASMRILAGGVWLPRE